MNKKEKGSITVFLSLIMLLVIALVFTTIEISRVSSAYTRSNEITYLGLDSTFSLYAREVFERYGIMVLWKDEANINEIYESFINKNANYRKDFVYKPFDILGIRVNKSKIDNITMATDMDGELLYNQVCDYMKIAISEDVVNKILENCTSLTQGEDVNNFYEELDECTSKLEEMESSVEKINDSISEINKIENNPVEVLENMKNNLEKIINIPNTDTYNIQVRDNIFDMYKVEFRKYLEWEQTNKRELDNILINTNRYFDLFNDVKNSIAEVEDRLEKYKDNYIEDLYKIMKNEIDNLNEEIINQEKDIYNVSSNENASKKQKEIVDNVADNMGSIMERTEEIDYSYSPLSSCEDADDLISNSYKNIVNALNKVKDYDNSLLYVNYSGEKGKKKKNEIVEFVKKIKKDGVLSYVAKGDISNKDIVKDTLPSMTSKVKNGKEWKSYGAGQDAIRKALVGQYIFDNFGRYTSSNNTENLEYEAEYILFGENNDKDNLSKVVNKLALIREPFNLLFLLKDTAKREEAYNLALAITGFTGMPAVTRITQLLLMSAWAYAESVVDVKDLLNGYRVNIIKNADEWNLSLNGIKNLESDDKDKEHRKGLSYDDYLRVLLFGQNKSIQIYRIMDLIQINIKNKYNNDFKLKDCIIGCSVYTEYKIKRLFTNIGFIRKIILNKDNEFFIKVRQSFSY